MKKILTYLILLMAVGLPIGSQQPAYSAMPTIATAASGACSYSLFLPIITKDSSVINQAAAPIVNNVEIAQSVTKEGTFADFNGDGCADLAIGVPNLTVQGKEDAGGFYIYYGSRNGGLPDNNIPPFTQDHPLIDGDANPGEQFGYALEMADFNGDGYTDLAVSAPFADVLVNNAGEVMVFYGSANGLSLEKEQTWSQATNGVSYANEASDRFGLSLTSGYFDDDKYADLVIGIPKENVGNIPDAGALYILPGSATGLITEGSRGWSQDNIPGVSSEDFDNFGFALAAGDFDNSGTDDLAIGAPFEDGQAAQQGQIFILYSEPSGLSTTKFASYSQGAFGSNTEQNDEFGYALATGDFNNDDYADLVIGARGESVIGLLRAGAFSAVYGSDDGLDTDTGEEWNLASLSVPGDAQAQAQLGTTITTGDFNGDGYDDVAAGAPLYDSESPLNPNAMLVDAGHVLAMFGTDTGIRSSGSMWFDMIGLTATGDLYGSALFAADFNDDGRADLAVGIPSRANNLDLDAGAVEIQYGAPDGFGTTTFLQEENTINLGATLP